jgi:ribose transport system ATP-binding protein
LIKLSRRILVFREKRIVGEIKGLNERTFDYGEISQEIGQYLA